MDTANIDSVVEGLGATARVITAAALIMISVFLGFVASDDPVVKMMGVGLATAVAVDATIVRMVLVPVHDGARRRRQLVAATLARPDPAPPRPRPRRRPDGERRRPKEPPDEPPAPAERARPRPHHRHVRQHHGARRAACVPTVSPTVSGATSSSTAAPSPSSSTTSPTHPITVHAGDTVAIHRHANTTSSSTGPPRSLSSSTAFPLSRLPNQDARAPHSRPSDGGLRATAAARVQSGSHSPGPRGSHARRHRSPAMGGGLVENAGAVGVPGEARRRRSSPEWSSDTASTCAPVRGRAIGAGATWSTTAHAL